MLTQTYFYGWLSCQQMDLFLPDDESPKAVFLYFHGGSLESGDKSDGVLPACYLTRYGIAVASANYRMYPQAHYPDFIEDAARAVAFLKSYLREHGMTERLFVGGSSAGGYLSMMLCFDARWLAPYGIRPEELAGYIHDAGQPTCHFNVLRERGLDGRRLIVDDSAPLFHVGEAESYAPMLFLVSDMDMFNRREQTEMMLSTMRHFNVKMEHVETKLLHGRHCAYIGQTDENGESVFGKLIEPFIKSVQ